VDARAELVFMPVETVEEVLKEALGIGLPPRTGVLHAENSVVPVQNL
jgi:ATP-dependent Lon protease